MAASYNKFNAFTGALVNGLHNFNSGAYHLMLSDATFVATQNSYTGGTSNLQSQEIVAGNGYTAGGPALTITVTNTSGNTVVKAANVTINATGGSIGPFEWVGIYGGTGNGAVCWFDNGNPVTLNAGDSFTVNFDQSNGLFSIA